MYLPWAHNIAKVLNTWFTKIALLKFSLELVLSQSLEKKPHMILMLMFSSTENKYIIQVDKHKDINGLPHDTIHQPLEGWWGIVQS